MEPQINQANSPVFPQSPTPFHHNNQSKMVYLLIFLTLISLCLTIFLGYQNYQLQKQLKVVNATSAQNTITLGPTNQTFPTIDVEKSPSFDTSNWKTGSIIGTGSADGAKSVNLTFKYPPEYYLDYWTLSNYDYKKESNPGAPISGNNGKCDFSQVGDIPSQGGELVSRDIIQRNPLVEKITEKSSGPLELITYYVVGTDPKIIGLWCYGKWADDASEIEGIINTFNFK